MRTALTKVVDLPSFTVFADDDTGPEGATVMEISWHPAEGPKGHIRLTGVALDCFNGMLVTVPPATLVRAIFTQPDLRAEVESTPGFEELAV